MRQLLIFAIICASGAKAQVVSVDCPSSYPPKASVLEVAPPGHAGKGLVPAGNPLKDWSVFDGEFDAPAQIHAGEPANVNGGTDTKVPPARWFVCYYRGGVSWWNQTGADSSAEKGRLKEGCVVQTREQGKAFRLVCK